MKSVHSYQSILQGQLSKVSSIYSHYAFDLGQIEKLTPLIEHFEIRVPLIGAFSCGKSSLLNALLEERLLATAVTPETAVPAELRFAPERSFEGCLPDGRTITLQEADLREGNLSALASGNGWVQAGLPHSALASRPQLVLVDLPGWDSGIEAHNRVIDGYADRSLAYGVVVSVDEGTLRASLRQALLELAIARMPVLLIISKAESRTPEDVQQVTQKIQEEITSLTGQEPLAVVITSARKKDLGNLPAALDQLQAKAGALFETRIVTPYRQQLQSAIEHLNLLANQDNKDAARIQADMEKLQQDMQAFDSRLQRETQALEEQIGPILGTIRLRVENALSDRIEMLTSQVLNGQNISDDILGTARLVMSEALRQEFEPAMQRYLDRLVDALPSRLDFKLELGDIQPRETSGGEFRWKALSTALAPLLLKIPHPVGKLLAPVALLLGALFDSKADEQRKRVEAARQREAVRSRIHGALSDATRQIDAQLRPALAEQVQKAQAEVARNIEAERQEIEHTLSTLVTALQEGEAQVAALRERAQADRAQLQAMLDEIPATA